MPLTASVLHDDALALLSLEGELDLAVVGQVDDAVAEVLADGRTLLVVDLVELRFCDSSGLGALLRATRAVRAAGGTCLVAGARGPVQRLLELTSMGRVLDLSSEVGTALAELRDADEDATGADFG